MLGRLKALAEMVRPLALPLALGLLVVATVLLLAWVLDLAPPRTLTMAAGRPGGGYEAVAERYRDILAEDGITLEVIETAGSAENADLIARGEVDVALMQGGVPIPDGEAVEALAAIFLEPFFVFYRGEVPNAADPTAWGDLAVAVGEPGSGTRAAIETAARMLGFTLDMERTLPIGGMAAAEALLDGRVHVGLFVTAVDAPFMRRLLTADAIEIAPIRDAEALTRRMSYLSMVDIPPSAIDYVRRIPKRRVELTAMTASLAARASLHPALVDRLTRAAIRIHDGGSSLVNRDTRFPHAYGLELPINRQAEAMLMNGPGGLDEILPWWIAAQINRVALLFLPVLVLALPLLRALPGLYAWRMRARVYTRYDELIAIDHEASTEPGAERRRDLIARLDEIEAEARSLKVPASYRERAYALRMHIDLVRRRLRAMQAGDRAPSA